MGNDELKKLMYAFLVPISETLGIYVSKEIMKFFDAFNKDKKEYNTALYTIINQFLVNNTQIAELTMQKVNTLMGNSGNTFKPFIINSLSNRISTKWASLSPETQKQITNFYNIISIHDAESISSFLAAVYKI